MPEETAVYTPLHEPTYDAAVTMPVAPLSGDLYKNTIFNRRRADGQGNAVRIVDLLARLKENRELRENPILAEYFSEGGPILATDDPQDKALAEGIVDAAHWAGMRVEVIANGITFGENGTTYRPEIVEAELRDKAIILSEPLQRLRAARVQKGTSLEPAPPPDRLTITSVVDYEPSYGPFFGRKHTVALEQDPFIENLQSKIDATWGSCVGDDGYCDLDKFTERLWKALYEPETALAGVSKEVLEETRTTLTKAISLTTASGTPPSIAELIPAIYEAIKTVDVRKTLFPGAMDQLKKLDKDGRKILVWTAGSKKHQQIKLARSGLIDNEELRNLEVLYPKSKLEVGAAINEDKFVPDIIEKIRTSADKQKIVVVEDRTKNIVQFLDAFSEAKGLWVLQGAHAKKTLSTIFSGLPETDEKFKHLLVTGK